MRDKPRYTFANAYNINISQCLLFGVVSCAELVQRYRKLLLLRADRLPSARKYTNPIRGKND